MLCIPFGLRVVVCTAVLAVLSVFFCPAANAGQLEIRRLPVPETVSPELRTWLAFVPDTGALVRPDGEQALKDWIAAFNANAAPAVQALAAKLGVTITEGLLGGVRIYTVTPATLPEAHKDRVLLHLHGGAYMLNAGVAGAQEAVLLAAIAGFKSVVVDYRMAPEFPFPAGIDDALTVYRELLKTTPAKKIGVFGSSAGGGMVLSLMLRAKQEGLPLAGALGAGTPCADLSRTGDSYTANEGVDNILISYDFWLVKDGAALYAAGRDLKDPMLSPVYGDVTGFPPTQLATGTRDLFLSNTVRMHKKLREAGVQADLLVYEAQPHGLYLVDPAAPETRFHYTELGRFFDAHLQ